MATKAKPKSKAASASRSAAAKVKTAPTPVTPAVSNPPAKQAASSGFRLNPPKMSTFWASMTLGVVGLLVYLLHISKLLSFTWSSPLAFVLMLLAFVLLVLGLLVKGF